MKLNKDKILKDRHERQQVVLSPDYLKQYNKCWIAQDESGRIVGFNKTYDIVQLADELKKKYHSQQFKFTYVDIKEVIK